MPPRPLPSVLTVAPYKAGESALAGVAKPIKLASNENPFGASPEAQAAYRAALGALHIYPDPGATKLRQAIAHRFGLDPDRIVCGAGSDDIFAMLIRAYLGPGDNIVQSAHAFSIYRIFAMQGGGEVRSAPEPRLVADVDAMLAEVTEATRLVFLANPNNPTGTYLPIGEVRRLHAGLPGDVVLVLDAAYAEYVRRNDYAAGLELVAEADNVIMTRTFSKVHGLAALRVGWAYASAAIVDALNRVRSPFNVSAPAQAAAAAAIADAAFLERSVAHNAAELARVSARLEALGFPVTESVANFVLAHFPDGAGRRAADADAALRQAGVIVRRMEGYGLPHTLRISIGKTEENDAALDALAAFAA